MEVSRLTQDELLYECTIRGIATGKVDDMRMSLRPALKLEKEGRDLIIKPYPYTFEDDATALKKKVEEIEQLLETYTGETGCFEYKKVLTKIEWAFRRVNRMQASDEDQKKSKATIRASIIMALGTLRIKADGDNGDNDDDDDSSDSADEPYNPSLPVAGMISPRSRVALYKWGIHFSGEHTQSVNSFLDRVNELAEARGVTKQQLFRSALDLFTGAALIWYRANKSNFHSWGDLVQGLKREFLPSDYDDRLLEEIKRRTQGKEETMGMYVAVMMNMFARLTDPITEAQKIKILKRNITPFYQTQLGLTKIESIQELVELGKCLESVRTSVEGFIPPPSRRSNHLLEPDLAYAAVEHRAVATMSDSRPRSGNQKCFKCNQPGHIARFCRQNLRCYGCGTNGVTRPNCPRCSRDRNVQSNSTQAPPMSGNGTGARN